MYFHRDVTLHAEVRRQVENHKSFMLIYNFDRDLYQLEELPENNFSIWRFISMDNFTLGLQWVRGPWGKIFRIRYGKKGIAFGKRSLI